MAHMADDATMTMPDRSDTSDSAALQHRTWPKLPGLSSVPDRLERFLVHAGFDRAPWLAVGFSGGILLWFGLDNPWQWLAALCACAAIAMATLALLHEIGRFPYLRLAMASMALATAAGCGTVWVKSALVGTPPIARPLVPVLVGKVLDRDVQTSQERVRLMLATTEPGSGRSIRVRLNLPLAQDRPEIAEGATVRLRARLMPPAPPMLPGGHDFARTAWFAGIAATGGVLGEVTVLHPGDGRSGLLKRLQVSLSNQVLEAVPGSAGTIAAAFASGYRGGIAKEDDAAMRDAGLSHLLSISGLHVSAVIAATYFVAARLFALFPWLALRVPIPIMAAGSGALAGVFYTLLTGAEVPTVRSCLGGLLVLAAMALGREPLSLRMVAVAAIAVMLLWPEAVVGPSFQMSFAAVIAIIAVHGSAPARHFLAPREEGMLVRAGRHLVMLLVTGLVIEFALMPIGLYHFHRAGVYGALANVIAIPLTTFVSMPAIAAGLIGDLVGLGAPGWWVTGKSLQLMLAIAHWTAAQPGAVTFLPAMGKGSILLFAFGGFWLALWRGNPRLLGLLPIAIGTGSLAFLRPPDLLISGDGHQIGIAGEADEALLVIRESRSSYAKDNLTELAGLDGATRTIADWPGARCSRDFCAIELERGGRTWRLLISRGRDPVEERSLAAACDRSDIVIADRWLPRSCQPAVLKADRRLLSRTGGITVDLERRTVRTVADSQGAHGWWRGNEPPPPRRRQPPPSQKP